jgi:hypothetical protein
MAKYLVEATHKVTYEVEADSPDRAAEIVREECTPMDASDYTEAEIGEIFLDDGGEGVYCDEQPDLDAELLALAEDDLDEIEEGQES